MIAFWAIVTLMSAVVAAALVIPLLGKARSARDRREYDLAVYRDQLGEVDRDVARGVLADDQARATRTEIERRILAAAEDESPSGGDVPRPAAGLAPAQSTWALALTVAVLIPTGGFALYLYLGAPELPDAPFAGRSEALEQAAQSRSEMGGLLADLAERLRQAPDDLDGWALLARSYRSMDRPRESADAFARAVELSERAPSYLSAYGEMLVAAARGQVTPEGRQAFEEALAKEPGDSRARYYIGVAKEQAGDKAGALSDWQALVARADASAPWLEEIVAASGFEMAFTMDPFRAASWERRLALPRIGVYAIDGPRSVTAKVGCRGPNASRRAHRLNRWIRLCAYGNLIARG